ncbi:glycosyltransferase [Daejeonella sp. JGW-45]|uniref:glycosyltransferase n=1 Tax=Daejeonella sp. JGW-45 TaxID=3034148 RepID=UPI0023EB9FEA|nr:glycosyltransferase [Daejeonella sp. JGW-45]
MKIGFFLPSGIKGGAEQLIFQLIAEYQTLGHEIVVFFLTNLEADSFIKDLRKENISVYVCPVKREFIGYLILPFMCLWQTLFNRRFSLIFSSHVHLNSLVAVYRKLFFLKTETHLARESTLIFSRFKGRRLKAFRFFYNLGYKFIPNIICQTDLMRTELIRNLPWLQNTSRVIVLPNPINRKDIENKLLEAFDQPSFEYIVAAGSLTTVKGFDILIEAFSLTSASFPGLKLLILGEGPQRVSLENLIAKYNLSDRVSLIGWTQNVYPYFKYARTCVVSSRIEGFPNVLLQAMACSNTVVSTLCAGGIEAIPGIYTCQTESASALSEALNVALANDNFENRNVYDSYLNNNLIEQYVITLNGIKE